MNSGLNDESNLEQQRQIKIDADIDEVIKTIQGLGLKPDEKAIATDSSGENPSPRRNRWMRFAVWTVTIFAIGAFAGFVGAYNLHAPNGASDIRVIRSWEIRRAIPVEPEIRRAIPVQMEIRKAIPVQTRKPEVDQPFEAESLPPRNYTPLGLADGLSVNLTRLRDRSDACNRRWRKTQQCERRV
jgi:nitrate reductase NapE component